MSHNEMKDPHIQKKVKAVSLQKMLANNKKFWFRGGSNITQSDSLGSEGQLVLVVLSWLDSRSLWVLMASPASK